MIPARSVGLLLVAWSVAGSSFARADDPPPPSSVAKGEVLKFTFEKSEIFPGTVRDYWVYIPAQYDPGKPACVYVNQDGIQYNAPAVFDRLIASKEMPVTIGVFVAPGRVPAPNGESLDRFNRSVEYDTLSDAYAEFLLDELLPDVEKKTASDGRPLSLSPRPEDRAIGGASSGAICAFTVAWERPDAFRRVFSAIGTYVGLRGGNVYPTLVRKYEPKPLRIYLQDGSNDQNVNRGDWWMANQELERALTFAGYEVEHAWGDGGHDTKHATEIFPDAMRWLWKGWPDSPKAGKGSPQMQALLVEGKDWERVNEHWSEGISGVACAPDGSVVISRDDHSRMVRIDPDGQRGEALSHTNEYGPPLAFGPDGSLFCITGELPDRLIKLPPGGGEAVDISGPWKAPKGFGMADVVVDHRGWIFASDGSEPSLGWNDQWQSGGIWMLEPGRERRHQYVGASKPAGLALSPDHSLLYIADASDNRVWSFQVRPDGQLEHGAPYFLLHPHDGKANAGLSSLAVDEEGRLYVGTNLGVQVCDPTGRVDSILPLPDGPSPVTSLTFGGHDRKMLYAESGGILYRRPVQHKGLAPHDPPRKPNPPRL